MIASEKVEHTDDDLETPSKKIKLTRSPDEDLGLVEYIGYDMPKVSGIIKSRVEDFIVTELNSDNLPCELASFEVPERKFVELEMTEFVELPESTKTLLDQVLGGTLQEAEVSAPEDKEERTKLHHSIAKYNKSLSSSTETVGDKKVVRISRNNGSSERYRKIDENCRYLHFSILKWNISTNDVTLRLANILKTHPKRFGYAGLKDKRGITMQRMSCRNMDANRLAGITRKYIENQKDGSSKTFFDSNFVLGNFTYKKDGIFLGDNSGNRFSVVIRNCNINDSKKCDIIKASLLKNGFLNYFGKQRFGYNFNTHIVGKYILCKDYKSAVAEILKPNKESQKPDVYEALKAYETSQNAGNSITCLKFKTGVEGLVLSSLAKKPTNFKEAIKKLPRKQQTFYCHAFQSIVFNRLLSERKRKFGLVVLPGDLVYKGHEILQISEAEVPSYTIDQILLPLPGIDVTLPGNECKSILEHILMEEGLGFNDINKSTAKEFDISGSYRNMVVIPGNLDILLKRYSTPTDKLIKTEYDRLLGTEFDHVDNGELYAMLLEFNLPKSAYATMLIREIGKGEIE